MKKEFEVTKYLIYSYERQTGNRIQSELKLQKLMYFSQRESLCLTGHQLFDEEFEGWIHGLSLIHISEPTRQCCTSRMPSSA